MKDLILVDDKNPLVFDDIDGLEKVLRAIEEKARSEVPDMSTDKGRKRIKSIAATVARSKTALEKLKNSSKSDAKDRVIMIDRSWRDVRDRLDALRDEIRSPVTAFEDAEKARIATHQDGIDSFDNFLVGINDLNSTGLKQRMNEVQRIDISSDWQEFMTAAADAKQRVLYALEAATKVAITREEDARKATDKKNEQDRLALEEAKQRARQEAEDEAQEAIEDARKDKEEAEQRAKNMKQQAIKDAEERTRKEARAKSDARRREVAAAQRERDKMDAEQRAANDATLARQKDVEHRRKINRVVMAALTKETGLTEPVCKVIISAIICNKIPHVTINY